MLLKIASITGPLVTLATHLIANLGLAGVALLTLTSGVIGLPGTEPTMLFAGFDVFQGNLSLPGIIVAGVVGDVAGRDDRLLDRLLRTARAARAPGRPSCTSAQARLDRAHGWFERYGAPTSSSPGCCRLIRAVFPYAAGVARMPYGRFATLATLGSVIWIGGLGLLGRAVGSNWPSWRHHLEYVDYAAAAVLVLAIVYFFVRRARSNRDRLRRSRPRMSSPTEPGTSRERAKRRS